MICVILGSLLRNMLGEWEPIYDTYAKELNISDNVKFMGQKANVQTYIVNASVFVSSSDFEGMSNSMLEAMAIGLPVVCTDCPIGGARMVIKNNINGILTPVGDDRIFADEIIGLLKNPEKAKRLGKQASELREQLNVKKIAKESLMRDVSLMSRLQLRAICLMLRVPAFWTSSLAAW